MLHQAGHGLKPDPQIHCATFLCHSRAERVRKWLLLHGLGSLSATHFAHELVRILSAPAWIHKWPDEQCWPQPVRKLAQVRGDKVVVTNCGAALMDGRGP